MRQRLEAQRLIKKLWAIEECVAMEPAEPREFRVLEPGNSSEDAHLIAMAQLRLEADEVVKRAERIVLPQLHDRIGPPLLSRIFKPDRLHRPKAQRVGAARCHHLDRQAAIEIGRVL